VKWQEESKLPEPQGSLNIRQSVFLYAPVVLCLASSPLRRTDPVSLPKFPRTLPRSIRSPGSAAKMRALERSSTGARATLRSPDGRRRSPRFLLSRAIRLLFPCCPTLPRCSPSSAAATRFLQKSRIRSFVPSQRRDPARNRGRCFDENLWHLADSERNRH
jgi:hypothetical protein